MPKSLKLIIPALALLALTGCVAHQSVPALPNAPGFLLGLWHGFIVVFTMIASIFFDVRIYAVPNSGFWYDLGFFIGCCAALGGGAAGAKRRKR